MKGIRMIRGSRLNARGWDLGSILTIDFDWDDRMVEVKPDGEERF